MGSEMQFGQSAIGKNKYKEKTQEHFHVHLFSKKKKKNQRNKANNQRRDIYPRQQPDNKQYNKLLILIDNLGCRGQLWLIYLIKYIIIFILFGILGKPREEFYGLIRNFIPQKIFLNFLNGNFLFH